MYAYFIHIECNSYDIRLVDTSVQYNSDGTADVTGVVEFCNDNTWNTVCEDGITPNDATQFCREYGYDSKLYSFMLHSRALILTSHLLTLTHSLTHSLTSHSYRSPEGSKLY